MFTMSAFSCDARRESFAKAQKRFADCFTRQIVPDSLHSPFRTRCVFTELHMQCRLGLAMRILSVYPSVRLSVWQTRDL